MTTPGKRTEADIAADRDPAAASCAPTPYHLGLTANPDRSWEDIGITEPTPFDLGWIGDPDMSWERFVELLDEIERREKSRGQTVDEDLTYKAAEPQDPEAGA